jgi:hypothetical protein
MQLLALMFVIVFQAKVEAAQEGGDPISATNKGEGLLGQSLAPNLSPQAIEVADLVGILPLYKKLREEQIATKASKSATSPLESIVRNQRIIYLRTKINQCFQTAGLEVNAVLGELNSGMAQLDHDKAMISDERARILRRNSLINLVSGGLTKVGGYSAALTPASLIPTNVLEVFDGTVQVGLSGSTLRQQRNESKVSKSTPDILTRFVIGENKEIHGYPDSLWRYLNQPFKNGSTLSRRNRLINNWLSTYPAFRKAYPAGSRSGSSYTRMNMEDLDETVAMLSDLKSLIGGMNESLVELAQFIKRSYDDDPEF